MTNLAEDQKLSWRRIGWFADIFIGRYEINEEFSKGVF
jgi:hypothetical protein